MSNANPPPTQPEAPPPLPPPPAPPPAQRNGWLTAFMVIFGVIMLLPGLCALIVGFASMDQSHPDPVVALLVVIGLLAAVGGVLLIRAAIRGRQP